MWINMVFQDQYLQSFIYLFVCLVTLITLSKYFINLFFHNANVYYHHWLILYLHILFLYKIYYLLHAASSVCTSFITVKQAKIKNLYAGT